MTEYVCGFLVHRGMVALVRKNRPAWQAGRHNGVGGRVEPGESPRAAMAREFKEEAGVDTFESDWRECVVLTGGGRRVRFYRGTRGGPVKLADATDEKVGWFDPMNLPPTALDNLRWLVPLCLDDAPSFPIEITDTPSHVTIDCAITK